MQFEKKIGRIQAMRTRFTAREAATLAGVSYHQIDRWDRSGFVRPSVSPGSGTGSIRLYGPADLLELRIAGQMRAAGISLRALRRVVNHLRLRTKAKQRLALAGAYLVTDGHDVLDVASGQAVSGLRASGRGFLFHVVDLAGAVSDLEARTRDLPGKVAAKRGRTRRPA